MNVAEGGDGSRRTVQLMATCLCDLFFDDVARATVEVLEYLGCHVEVPADQTCCGQPAYSAGQWDAARRVARHALRVFRDEVPIVTPSGSCAKMLAHGLEVLFPEGDEGGEARRMAARGWELADFIVHGLGVTAWPGRLVASVVFHRSCHSRGGRSADAALSLLRSIDGLTVIEAADPEQCCGFGGIFAVSLPNISRAIGLAKLDGLGGGLEPLLVSADMGCLMHLGGLARREGRALRTLHLGQLLRDAIYGAEPSRAA